MKKLKSLKFPPKSEMIDKEGIKMEINGNAHLRIRMPEVR